MSGHSVFYTKLLLANIVVLCNNQNKTNLVEKVEKNKIYIEELKSENYSKFIKIYEKQEVRKQHYGVRNESSTNRRMAEFSWKKIINSKKEPYLKYYGIFLKKENSVEMVGFINFFKEESTPDLVYIAYSIDPEYWNKGIGTFGVALLIEKFREDFKKRKIKKILATVKMNNIGSIRILIKNGFVVKEDILCNKFPAKLLELRL